MGKTRSIDRDLQWIQEYLIKCIIHLIVKLKGTLLKMDFSGEEFGRIKISGNLVKNIGLSAGQPDNNIWLPCTFYGCRKTGIGFVKTCCIPLLTENNDDDNDDEGSLQQI